MGRAFGALGRVGSGFRPVGPGALNIVEGFDTDYRRRRLNFLYIAQSSLAEVGYCIHAAFRLGYMDEKLAAELDLEIRKVGAPQAGLIASERLKRLKIDTRTAGVIVSCFFLEAD
jgi:hypothetical protein